MGADTTPNEKVEELKKQLEVLQQQLEAKGQIFNIAILRIHSPLLAEFGGKVEC